MRSRRSPPISQYCRKFVANHKCGSRPSDFVIIYKSLHIPADRPEQYRQIDGQLVHMIKYRVNPTENITVNIQNAPKVGSLLLVAIGVRHSRLGKSCSVAQSVKKGYLLAKIQRLDRVMITC